MLELVVSLTSGQMVITKMGNYRQVAHFDI